MVAEADDGTGKGLAQLGDALQADDFRWRGVEVGALQQGVVHARSVQRGHGWAHGVDGLHAGAHDDGLAKAGDVADERHVVALARPDLETGHTDVGQKVGSCSRKRGGDVDQPQVFGVFFEGDFVVFGQRAFLHHVPDGFVGVGREDAFGFIGHFVVNEMGLVFDHFTAGQAGGGDHGFGHVQAAAVVDADFGDDQGRVFRADVAVGDFHVSLLRFRRPSSRLRQNIVGPCNRLRHLRPRRSSCPPCLRVEPCDPKACAGCSV